STIGALRVVIGADTTGFQRGAKEARDGLDGIQKSSKAAIVTVAALGAAAVAAGAKLFSMARAELDLIDSQSKLSRSIGGTVDGLRSMKIAAENNGIDGLESSLNRMNRRLGAVEMAGGPAAETVKQLGLNVKALAEMDIDERLAHIADAIQASGMSAQEAARHLQQLGFQQQEATAFFMQGGDAIREARQELERYGLSISQLDAARIEDATTAFSRVGRAIDGIRTQLTIALLPAMLKAADMAEAVARGVAMIAPSVGRMVDGLIRVAEYAGVAVAGIAALYAPAAISGIATFTTAVGVGAVGAVKSLTAAMLANPIGAIAAALVAAGYAAYKF